MLTAIIIFILLGFFGLLGYYLSRRIFQGLTYFLPRLKFWHVLVFFQAMTLWMLLGFASSMLPVSPGAKQILNRICMSWMGVFIYLLMFTVLGDLLGLAFKRTPAFRAIRMVCVVVLALATVVYGRIHVNQIQVVTYEVTVQNKTDISDMNIVLISDLHLGALGSEERLSRVVSRINSLEPDLVCIAGDVFDTDFDTIRDPQKAINTLRKLSATYGIYACLGNHDAGQTAGKMLDFLEACDIQVLNEAYTVIDDRLILAGRLDGSPIGDYPALQRGDLADFLKDYDTNLPVIVLDHNPGHIDEYTDQVDLVLSGHTHQGQMFPANIFTHWMYAIDYGHGQPHKDGPQLIVTSGVGYWGMPMRIGTDCEIVQIRIGTIY